MDQMHVHIFNNFKPVPLNARRCQAESVVYLPFPTRQSRHTPDSRDPDNETNYYLDYSSRRTARMLRPKGAKSSSIRGVCDPDQSVEEASHPDLQEAVCAHVCPKSKSLWIVPKTVSFTTQIDEP